MATDLDKGHERVVDPHTHWQEESASRGEVVESPQLLVFTNATVIPLGGFLEVLLVLGHLLGIREGHPVNSLEGVVLGISEEV